MELQKVIPFNRHLEEHLQFWMKPENLLRVQAFCARNSTKIITDASKVRFRSHGKSDFSGNLVYAEKGNAHQLVRTRGSLLSNRTFSPTFTGSLSVDKIGQHDSCPIYQQTMGNKISSTVLSGVGFMASGSKEHVSKISSCGRQPQYTSRQSQ